MRSDRTHLPDQLRYAMEAHTGPITGFTPAPGGSHADIAATLHTSAGRLFIKAAEKLDGQDGPEVRALRREAAINPFVREFTPRLHWTVEAGGWLALGFEHVDGRHANYAPGSPDLVTLSKTVRMLQAAPCPEAVEMRVERRVAHPRRAHPDAWAASIPSWLEADRKAIDLYAHLSAER